MEDSKGMGKVPCHRTNDLKEPKNNALAMSNAYWYILICFGAFFVTAVITCAYSEPAVAATLVVSNTNDSGIGSLRQAIISAAPGDTINFDIDGTITLTSGYLQINKDLTINGPGASILAISGNNNSKIFDINGGGIDINVHISHITITNGNSGGIAGGGIRIAEACSVTLANSIISHNVGGIGGGINNVGSLTMTDVTIDSNFAAEWGGGISNTGNMLIHNSTVSGNTAVIGGGILNAVSIFSDGHRQAGTTVLENVTLSGNSASDSGGGIASGGTNFNNEVFPTSLVLTNCTIMNNSASIGGGLFYVFGTTIARNTIIATSSSGGNCNSIITSLGHNLESSNTCGFTSLGDIINSNPLVGVLADNGGFTQTHALLSGSPAIDAADPANFPSFDQRGVTRPQGAAPDIGAYEVDPPTGIPTMTEWGMILFMVFAGGGAIYYLKRQKRVQR